MTTLASVIRAEQELLLPTYDRHKILFTRGRGVYLWDSEGKRYLDFLSGIGVNALGHAHPAIQKVLKQQAGKLIHISNLFYHEYQAELAKRLTKISGLDRAFFCNSGTEAWEGALKMARAYAQEHNSNGHKAKWRLLALENSFHGRTFGSLATTGQAKYRHPFAPMMPGVDFVAFNDVADLKRQFDGSVCAICMETIQGEGGINPVSQEFLQTGARTDNDIRRAVDCWMKSKAAWAAPENISPISTTESRRISSPSQSRWRPGCRWARYSPPNRVATGMHPGMHGTTFGGGPLACAVAIEFLRQLDGLLGHVERSWRSISSPSLRTCRRSTSSVKGSRHGTDAGHRHRLRRHREGSRRPIIAAGNSDQSHARNGAAFPAAVHHREEARGSGHSRARPCAQLRSRRRQAQKVCKGAHQS